MALPLRHYTSLQHSCLAARAAHALTISAARDVDTLFGLTNIMRQRHGGIVVRTGIGSRTARRLRQTGAG